AVLVVHDPDAVRALPRSIMSDLEGAEDVLFPLQPFPGYKRGCRDGSIPKALRGGPECDEFFPGRGRRVAHRLTGRPRLQPHARDIRLRRARSPREGGVAGVQMGEVRDL